MKYDDKNPMPKSRKRVEEPRLNFHVVHCRIDQARSVHLINKDVKERVLKDLREYEPLDKSMIVPKQTADITQLISIQLSTLRGEQTR